MRKSQESCLRVDQLKAGADRLVRVDKLKTGLLLSHTVPRRSNAGGVSGWWEWYCPLATHRGLWGGRRWPHRALWDAQHTAKLSDQPCVYFSSCFMSRLFKQDFKALYLSIYLKIHKIYQARHSFKRNPLISKG